MDADGCVIALPPSHSSCSADCVTGTYRSMDADGSQVHLGQMATPMGELPEALLRGSDIVTITFKETEEGVDGNGVEEKQPRPKPNPTAAPHSAAASIQIARTTGD